MDRTLLRISGFLTILNSGFKTYFEGDQYILDPYVIGKGGAAELGRFNRLCYASQKASSSKFAFD